MPIVAIYTNRASEQWILDSDANAEKVGAINLTQAQGPWIEIKKQFEKKGWSVVTWLEVLERKIQPDFVIFVNIQIIPVFILKMISRYNFSTALILFESPNVSPWGFWSFIQKQFDLIFRWDIEKDSTDIKLLHPASFNFSIRPRPVKSKENFSLMVTANKPSDHSRSLQGDREAVIKWFEGNNSDKFDLYGMGWEEDISKFRAVRVLARILGVQPKKVENGLKVYKGKANDKWQLMSKYKFVFSFENASYPWWITEKLFDVIYARSVPVYFGAPNIQNMVDKSLYIDYRDFKDMNELFDYLKNMNEEKYNEYICAADNYFESNEFKKFSDKTFANIIVKNILIKWEVKKQYTA